MFALLRIAPYVAIVLGVIAFGWYNQKVGREAAEQVAKINRLTENNKRLEESAAAMRAWHQNLQKANLKAAEQAQIDAEVIADMESINERLTEEVRRNGGNAVVFDKSDTDRLRDVFRRTKARADTTDPTAAGSAD